MRITIHAPEVHIHKIAVEANSLDDAVAKLNAGDVSLDDIIGVEYSHTLDSNTWKVELPSGELVSIDEARAAFAQG
jgi:hypothetical protein